MTTYAELAVTTNFSFLRGASHPQEMVARARELGLAAIGVADRNSLAGVVRAYGEWKRDPSVKLIIGARLVTTESFEAIAYPTNRQAYGRLCRLLTDGKRKAKKNTHCDISFDDIVEAGEGQIFIVMPSDQFAPDFVARLEILARAALGRCYLAGVHRHRGDEPRRLGLLNELGRRTGAPMVAVNDVFYHTPERRPLADVVACIREKCTIAEAGFRLNANAERYLKSPEDMARLFEAFPDAIERTTEIADMCLFDLGALKNEYPDEPVPLGKDAQQHLEDLAWAGARRRYPKERYFDGIPREARDALVEELALIKKLDYARYFLTVHDVVAFARDQDILCQGRGSAANSVVCFCLGITEVDPTRIKLLFARFMSENRGEPPDIDVDFEHERREEVIQYIYERYDRDHAAICATVIHYRSRRAIRDVGKVMGLTPDVTATLAKTVWGYGDDLPESHVRQAGLDPDNPAIKQAVALANEIIGFPRHLSQHVGGFILTRERLDETVPIGNAAMVERTFIEWDKDDIDTLKLMKVDVLALGMLTCIRRGFDIIKKYHGEQFSLANLPGDGEKDKKKSAPVYAMIQKADTVGVFQIESRAQMSMLPRLKPENFYDLVIEVAIVRPGPIQGDMVHPYLKRRDALARGEEPTYPSPTPPHDRDELKEVLKRTLGVPLFQEQAMQIAIDAAEFSPDEANGLRRAMATFRHNGTVHLFEERFIGGMVRKGYPKDFAERCFNQIKGFGEYGFPESHAASFAHLVWASAWMKCHYPEVFCAAILNSQPMGFYQSAQLVRDARQHGVEVREVDVNRSDWECTLEEVIPDADKAGEETILPFAVRLGFNQVKGLNEDEMIKFVAGRGNGYRSIERLAATAHVSRFTIERLADADAFRSMEMDRRVALWGARRLGAIGVKKGNRYGVLSTNAEEPLPLLAPHMSDDLFPEQRIALPAMQLSEHVAEDYVATGLSLKEHPVAFFREDLTRLGAIRNSDHRNEGLPQNAVVTVSGLVLIRQQPGTAKRVVFLTLEDETDIANIIIWPKIFKKNRRTIMTSRFLAVRGRIQRAGLVIHVLAESFIDLTVGLSRLRDGDVALPTQPNAHQRQSDLPLLKSRDFH